MKHRLVVVAMTIVLTVGLRFGVSSWSVAIGAVIRMNNGKYLPPQ